MLKILLLLCLKTKTYRRKLLVNTMKIASNYTTVDSQFGDPLEKTFKSNANKTRSCLTDFYTNRLQALTYKLVDCRTSRTIVCSTSWRHSTSFWISSLAFSECFSSRAYSIALPYCPPRNWSCNWAVRCLCCSR